MLEDLGFPELDPPAGRCPDCGCDPWSEECRGCKRCHFFIAAEPTALTRILGFGAAIGDCLVRLSGPVASLAILGTLTSLAWAAWTGARP